MRHLIRLYKEVDSVLGLSRVFDILVAKKLTAQFSKYGVVALVGYPVLIVGSYALVEHAGLSPSFAYLIALSATYVWAFLMNVFYVFRIDFNRMRIVRYLVAIAVFWALNNAFFHMLTMMLGVYYLAAAVLNIALFSLIRFFVYRRFVFN